MFKELVRVCKLFTSGLCYVMAQSHLSSALARMYWWGSSIDYPLLYSSVIQKTTGASQVLSFNGKKLASLCNLDS